MKNSTTYLKVKSVTVFATTGTGRNTKSTPKTIENIYARTEGSFIFIPVFIKNGMFEEKKSMNSKYFEIDAKTVTKATYAKNIKRIGKEITDRIIARIEAIDKSTKQHEEELLCAQESAIEQIRATINQDIAKFKEINSQLIEAKNGNDKADWHIIANRLTCLVDPCQNLVKYLGWQFVYKTARNLIR